MEMKITKPRFTLEESNKAFDEWRFNCGPGALCAILDRTPAEIRPCLLDFEKKGYTNPSLMASILGSFGCEFTQVYRADQPGMPIPPLKWGVCRIQWSGKWTRPGVPMRARYRHTHWIGVTNEGKTVFDINAMNVGGWISADQWSSVLVPWLLKDTECDGGWWPTHGIEVIPP